MNTISNNSIAEVNSVELNGKGHGSNIDGKNVQNDASDAGKVNGNNNDNINVSEQTVKETEKADMSSKQMEMVAQQLQEFVGKMNKGLEFSVHQDSGRDVIKVIDKNNGDLIKQYPTEEVLDLVTKLSDATGSLVNEEV